MFCCTDHKAAKTWASFWTFKQNWVNLKDNGYPIFSYVNAIYTIWEKIVWYFLEWKRLRCSVQGEGDQDYRNVNDPFERKVLLC